MSFEHRLYALALLAFPLAPIGAQSDSRINASMRDSVVTAVTQHLADEYVFPDVGVAMGRDVRSRMRAREYDTVSSANAFAALLTSDLRGISHDKHIVVEWSRDPLPEHSKSSSTAGHAAEMESQRKRSAFTNYGFRTAERLAGNIGYLALTYFDRPEFGMGAAASAMAFLHNTDALIIDLRDNDGGRPEMVALLISYLVDKPTRLTGLYWRKSGHVDSASTVPLPDSVKYLGKNVYLLTSNEGTISAGEAFAYDLHVLKRAILVGEISAGAANPGGYVRLTDHFQMFLPTGRAVNPITGTNWEGVGIKPDIEVPAPVALKRAHLEALKILEKSATDADRRDYLRSAIEKVENDAR
jgi:C-terminal processing protease CtpA/Prc